MLKNDPASGDHGCSTASQGSQPPCVETHPPPPIPPFLLAQNLSSKQIAPTYTAKVRQHQKASSVIKGLNMWPTVCKFPIPHIEQLQLLRYSKFQITKAFLWLQTMDKCKVYAWSTNECAIQW